MRKYGLAKKKMWKQTKIINKENTRKKKFKQLPDIFMTLLMKFNVVLNKRNLLPEIT